MFNDVFVKEKPQVCQKYYLTEVNIVELDTKDPYFTEMCVAFRQNFADSTSKETNYLNDPFVKTFMRSMVKSIKKTEGTEIQNFSPRKKNESSNQVEFKGSKGTIKFEFPNNGREFFFSNVLMKIYQVPVMFLRSSEDEYVDYESTFIVLFYEKCMRKRTYAKSQSQFQRIQRRNEVKNACINKERARILDEQLSNRDSKMRRFCNYFLTLFHQKKLNPFTQFVNTVTLKKVKHNVRLKMQYFTKGINKEKPSQKKKSRNKRKAIM